MWSELYTVIVNWNLKEDTSACVRSLVKAGSSLDHILVVDNHSSDGSVEAFKLEFGNGLPILALDTNLGYAGGLNAGIEWAQAQAAEWCLLLNNDVIVAEDFFDRLKDAIQTVDTPAILSPLIFCFQDPKRIWSAGDRLIPGTLLTLPVCRGIGDPDRLPVTIPVDFISGCAMFVHNDVFKKIGAFPTTQFMYGEEVDFCWRAKMAGIPRVVATRAHIWHKVSKSASMTSKKNSYWRIYNQIRFYRDRANLLQLPVLFAFTLVRSFWITVRSIIEKRGNQSITAMAAWRDGWFFPLKTISE